MCVVVLLQGMHSEFPLLVLHGRDEFWRRPTLPAQQRDSVVCGLDALQRGTWCGLHVLLGRAVLLTNFRTLDLPADKPLKSRGTLVLDLLNMQQVFKTRQAVAFCFLFVRKNTKTRSTLASLDCAMFW
jgi:uncharacterized protein with NRDE domain